MAHFKAYHLRNWRFIRDLSATGDIDILIKWVREKDPKFENGLNFGSTVEAFKNCSAAVSQEGFEACLNLSREEMGRIFQTKFGQDPNFEEFLKKLDEVADIFKEDWFETHVY